jgi:hypothetical protein
MRAKTFESLELGTGRKEMEGVLKRFKENEEEVLKEVEGIKRDLEKMPRSISGRRWRSRNEKGLPIS